LLVHPSFVLPTAVRVREWLPALPPGDVRSIALHWTAGDYTTVFPAYHFCLQGADDVRVVATHDPRANMRDVRGAEPGPYAAHVAGRNSWSLGIAVCAMGGATPADFGRWPITGAQVDALARVAHVVAAAYGVPLAAIRTHAESAVDDGYFGAGDDDQRWDIARLEASGAPLEPHEAAPLGHFLRARIAAAA
jgi:hypothetical protein